MRKIIQFIRKIIQLFRAVKLVFKYGEEALFKDTLTGCYVRVLLEELAGREINKAKRYGYSLCCLFIDVDKLKEINDKGGHKAGDRALKKVAEILGKNCREVDLFFRYGGDEFLILMLETTEAGANHFFERVSKELNEFSLSISMGVSVWRKELSLKELIAEADINLYKQKLKKRPG